MGTCNVVAAAVTLGIRKIVIASSETTYGIFDHEPVDQQHVPLDEEYDVNPADSYALSKICNEKTARAYATRSGRDICALRIGNVIAPQECAERGKDFADPGFKKRLAWSCMDARDLRQITRLRIETDGLGYEVFNVAKDESASNLPTRELLKRLCPDVPSAVDDLGEFETPLSNRKVRRGLGFRPGHAWHRYVGGRAAAPLTRRC